MTASDKTSDEDIETAPTDGMQRIRTAAIPSEAVSTIVRQYEKLIMKMAHKYCRNRVEYEDIMQEGRVGLVLACRDFNPKRSKDFHTYAIYRMKGKMYEYCIANENTISVPTHVSKAAAYLRQMQRALEAEAILCDNRQLMVEIMGSLEHPAETDLGPSTRGELSELKRKMANIARNSKTTYEVLAQLAFDSLSSMVSEDVLLKFPKETELVDELASNHQLRQQLRASLGERRFTVLSMRVMDWSYREIAEKLNELGYNNKQGQRITRQAVKAIYDETIRTIKRMRLFKALEDKEDAEEKSE